MNDITVENESMYEPSSDFTQRELINIPVKLEGGLRCKERGHASQSGRPLVSIITATFNAADLLSSTIKSIRDLTYDNIEWIIVDGASSDDTVDLIRQNEAAIDYWMSEPDHGIYDAWNKGVLLARGEWIAFIGAGDVYKPDALDVYMNAIMLSSVKPELVSSRVKFVDRAGLVKGVKGGAFEWDIFKKYMSIAHVGALHHRSLFERYGLFSTSYSSSGDYEFLMRCGADLRSMYLDFVSVDMLVGGLSDGYKGIFESYLIQRHCGAGGSAKFRYWIACAKRLIRPWLRGY